MSIEVVITKHDEANVTVRKFGDRTILEQTGHIKSPGYEFPVRIKFGIPDTQNKGYTAGTYTVAPQSFRVGKFEKLELNPFELHLIPLDSK